MVVFILFWNGSEEEGRAHFKPFFDIGKHELQLLEIG